MYQGAYLAEGQRARCTGSWPGASQSGRRVKWPLDLISRTSIRERSSKQRQRRLILHANYGSAMRAGMLEARPKDLGVLRSFSRPWASNENPSSKSLLRTTN